MKMKPSRHSVLSKTMCPSPKGKAIDDREIGAVGRRSFVSKMGIAGASLVLALLVTSSAMAQVAVFKGGLG